MITRKATMNDLERMLEIEESSIPGYGYLFENKEFYFDGIQNQGEMILALKDELPVGMGQYSILPDGSGWLEILRVHADAQHQGAGNAIYKRYMELAEQTHAPSIAMFTGHSNIASKKLAEKNGFELAETHIEYQIEINPKKTCPTHGFQLIKDVNQALQLLKDTRPWGKFLALNRTFFHYNEALIEWLCEKEMIYSNGESCVVLGCRMLKHRGWHIGFMSGNMADCLDFAVERTRQEKLPKLTISFPITQTHFKEALKNAQFTQLGELIVMELRRDNHV